MKRLRWQILVVLVTLVVVAGLLLSQQPAIQQTFVAQPVSGGVYTEAVVGSLSRLNPLLDLNNAADRDVDRLLFGSLIRFDGRGVPQPDLAQSWGISVDGTLYNVSIRPDAVWHDGEPVTSDDVIFTLGLLMGSVSAYPEDVKEMWKTVQVERLNDKTIKFTLPEPFAPFLDYLTFGLLPKHLLESTPPEGLQDAEFNIRPVGSGPYKFDHLLVEGGQITGIVLTAFEDYYAQAPFIQQVVFRYYPTSREALTAYQQGEVLGVSQITPDVLDEALEEPNLSVHTGRLPEMSLVLLNLNNPETAFLQETEVRRALMTGLNRQRLVDTLLQGQAIVADGPLFPGTWAYFDEIERITYDPEAATEMLIAAGYTIPAAGGEVREKEGAALSFTLLHPDDELHTAIAQSIQGDWAKLGVRVNLQAVPYDQLFFDHLVTRQYQAALVDLNLARSPDPDPYPFWHQAEATGGQNYSQWDNQSASEFLEQARVEVDPAARLRLYHNFQVVFSQELPSLPLFYPVYSFGVDSQVQGVQMPPLFEPADRFATINTWFLVTRRSVEPTATAGP
ncbi:MAG: ABC transporter substrate-binding protein [Chloroflexota bacterium]